MHSGKHQRMFERFFESAAYYNRVFIDIGTDRKTVGTDGFEHIFVAVRFGAQIVVLDGDGCAPIQRCGFESAACVAFDVERQTFDRVAHHAVRTQQKQLIVAAAIGATRAEALHETILIGGIVLYQHFHFGGVLRCPTAILIISQPDADNQSDNEQVPIVQKQADPFHDVE